MGVMWRGVARWGGGVFCVFESGVGVLVHGVVWGATDPRC